MQQIVKALDVWFRSGTSGVVILALLAAGTLLYVVARALAGRSAGERMPRALETAAFIIIAAAGLLLVLGAPFNE